MEPNGESLVFRPSGKVACDWWDNIGRDDGIRLIKDSVNLINRGSHCPASLRRGKAGFYTWLMMTVWGESCSKFGSRSRIDVFAELLSIVPDVIRLHRLSRPVVADLPGGKVDLSGIVGVSTFVPVRAEWGELFQAAKVSYYDLTAQDLYPNPGGKDTVACEQPAYFIVTNATVNLCVVEKKLSQSRIDDVVNAPMNSRYSKKFSMDDFMAVSTGTPSHLAGMLGKIRVDTTERVARRMAADGRVMPGIIPRVLIPQTGHGMFDGFLDKSRVPQYGRTFDNEKLYVLDLNLLGLGKGAMRIAQSLERNQQRRLTGDHAGPTGSFV